MAYIYLLKCLKNLYCVSIKDILLYSCSDMWKRADSSVLFCPVTQHEQKLEMMRQAGLTCLRECLPLDACLFICLFVYSLFFILCQIFLLLVQVDSKKRQFTDSRPLFEIFLVVIKENQGLELKA